MCGEVCVQLISILASTSTLTPPIRIKLAKNDRYCFLLSGHFVWSACQSLFHFEEVYFRRAKHWRRTKSWHMCAVVSVWGLLKKTSWPEWDSVERSLMQDNICLSSKSRAKSGKVLHQVQNQYDGLKISPQTPPSVTYTVWHGWRFDACLSS